MRIKIDTLTALSLKDAFEKIKVLEELKYMCDLETIAGGLKWNKYKITIYRSKRRDEN